MANQLGMDKVQAIFALHEVGWSNRRIARELGIHRTTVAGYLETRGDSKPTKVTTGSDEGVGRGSPTFPESLRTVSRDDCSEARPGSLGPANFPGPERRAWLRPQLRQRQAVRAAVAWWPNAAVSPDGVLTRRRGVSRFRHRSAAEGTGRQAEEDVCLSDRALSQPQGVQRGGESADDRPFA